MFVRKVWPRIAITAVVFSYSSPCAFGEVWPPVFPISAVTAVCIEASLFSDEGALVIDHTSVFGKQHAVYQLLSPLLCSDWQAFPTRIGTVNVVKVIANSL